MIEKKQKIKIIGWSLWVIGIMIVGFCFVVSLLKDKTEDNPNKVITPPSSSTTVDFIEQLEECQKLLKQTNVTPEYQKILQAIVHKLETKIQRAEEQKAFQAYLSNLSAEILDLEKQLNEQPLSLIKKNTLSGKKLKKEKELIQLKEQKDLFQEKEELQTQVLPNLEEKLKETSLTPQDKTNLTKEKTKWENRLQEIETFLIKIKNQQRIHTLEKLIRQEEEDESLTKLLEEEKNYLSSQI
ncbi:hypothetical protein [Candidatus Phytoplasma phoenicium]|uniref:Uncharacterized protein n=1 Tax=Candidatus Phytoplasma phoenicium TaxID=198422 RepID=A0A0L0MKB0_9MOLU|nr:hypothetical protein [Candidatus Phytoplasma phoenicium]KND62725.1 hypothetical protein AlmWB_00710 [Candidatus Phytoplasma phoenicium]